MRTRERERDGWMEGVRFLEHPPEAIMLAAASCWRPEDGEVLCLGAVASAQHDETAIGPNLRP